MSATRELPQKQQKLQPILGIPVHYILGLVILAYVALASWPLRWILSGAAPLTYILLLGANQANRILPVINLWTLVVFINLTYAVAATSWLLFWVYVAACIPTIFLACLFQFDLVGKFVRTRVRRFLKEVSFTNDKIAFFDLPALEIDVDVEGLMCIRGITFSLSSLTIIAHGIEVGIKFSDDMEIALVVDEVKISLFRRIDVSSVFGNVKGGELEMSLNQLADKSKTPAGKSLMVTDTPMLAAAAKNGDVRPAYVAMTEKMTAGDAPKEADIESSFKGVRQISPDDDHARVLYQSLLDYINESSIITVCQKEVEAKLKAKNLKGEILDNTKDLRSAICSQLHTKSTIPHPSKRAVRVSTLKTMGPPRLRAFIHRFPLLLRALLNPISYFHPVYIKSITAGSSGAWVEAMLRQQVFQDYPEQAPELRNLKKRMSAWLHDANFVFEADKITGMAAVPMNPIFDIISDMLFDDIMVYRTVGEKDTYLQIVRLGGADARISVPSFLLPHHEHLLPPVPTSEDKQAGQKKIDDADSQPKTLQAQQELKQMRKDETNINLSAHARLPAVFDQSLLDFVAALVKATKLIEMGRPESALDQGVHGFKEFTKAVRSDLHDKMRKVAVDAAANDKWIAKLVGKVTKKLETLQGDIGYSGDMPVSLEVYRKNAEPGTKIMP